MGLLSRIFFRKRNILSLGQADIITFNSDAFTAKTLYRTAKALERINSDLENFNASLKKAMELGYSNFIVDAFNDMKMAFYEEDEALLNLLRYQTILHYHKAKNLDELILNLVTLQKKVMSSKNYDSKLASKISKAVSEAKALREMQASSLTNLQINENNLDLNVAALAKFISAHDNQGLAEIIRKSSRAEFRDEKRERGLQEEVKGKVLQFKSSDRIDERHWKEFEQSFLKLVQYEKDEGKWEDILESNIEVLLARLEKQFQSMESTIVAIEKTKLSDKTREELDKFKIFMSKLRQTLQSRLKKLREGAILSKAA